jgi:hypothetical protein
MENFSLSPTDATNMCPSLSTCFLTIDIFLLDQNIYVPFSTLQMFTLVFILRGHVHPHQMFIYVHYFFYSKQPVDTNKNIFLRICTHTIFPRAQYVLFEKPRCVYMGQSTTKLTRPYLNMAHLVSDPHSSTQRKKECF